MHRVLRGVLVFAVLLTAGCSSNTTTTPTTTTTPVTITEPPFVGTLGPNQLAGTSTFAVGAGGTVTATLVSITPDSGTVIGMSLGTWNGTACAVVIDNPQATQGVTIAANLSTAGNLCVRAYVVTPLTNVETYTFIVTHP
jgi:ABC-type transport system substrate-binding protein